jgi:hypothetical protein
MIQAVELCIHAGPMHFLTFFWGLGGSSWLPLEGLEVHSRRLCRLWGRLAQGLNGWQWLCFGKLVMPDIWLVFWAQTGKHVGHYFYFMDCQVELTVFLASVWDSLWFVLHPAVIRLQSKHTAPAHGITLLPESRTSVCCICSVFCSFSTTWPYLHFQILILQTVPFYFPNLQPWLLRASDFQSLQRLSCL